MLSENDQQTMISSFLEIAVGQSAATARQFLQVGTPFLSAAGAVYDQLCYCSSGRF